jgi:hypothetical protein
MPSGSGRADYRSIALWKVWAARDAGFDCVGVRGATFGCVGRKARLAPGSRAVMRAASAPLTLTFTLTPLADPAPGGSTRPVNCADQMSNSREGLAKPVYPQCRLCLDVRRSGAHSPGRSEGFHASALAVSDTTWRCRVGGPLSIPPHSERAETQFGADRPGEYRNCGMRDGRALIAPLSWPCS